MSPAFPLLLLLLALALPSHQNTYTGIAITQNSTNKSLLRGRSPYYNSSSIFHTQCNKSQNFFLAIILPFTDRNFRVFTTRKNFFFENTKLAPLKLYSLYLSTPLASRLKIKSFVTNGNASAIFRACYKKTHCFALRIQHDPKKYRFAALTMLMRLKDKEHFLKVNKRYRRYPLNFVLETLADTTLETLIQKNALNNLQKIGLTHNLLEAMEHYSSHKIVHGNIKPGKILVRIDKNRYPNRPKHMDRKLIIFKNSQLEPWIFGFDRYFRLQNRTGDKYTKEKVLKKKLAVDFFDSTRKIRKKLKRYDSIYRPYESWFETFRSVGPSADVYAMGIVLYRLWFETLKGKFKLICDEERLSQCKLQFMKIEHFLTYTHPEYETEEECALEVIRKMTRFLPYERAYPEEAKLMFEKCLTKLGFVFEDEEEK